MLEKALPFHAICQNWECRGDLHSESFSQLNGMVCPRCGYSYKQTTGDLLPLYDHSIEPEVV
jgi:hypothetical protein